MSDPITFVGFPKMGRLNRDVIVTEKMDGTNAQITITDSGEMLVGSRTRWITPEDDNFGFARWCREHEEELLRLGPGRHFGEWWGSKIQRGYGIPEKRLSLFNTTRWVVVGGTPQAIPCADPTRPIKMQEVLPACVGLVPLMYEGTFDTTMINSVVTLLRLQGSTAQPGFMNPEGIVVFHTAANVGFKQTLDNDGIPKSKVIKLP